MAQIVAECSKMSDLDTLSVWESKWDMEFNPSKCQVVRVTTSRNPINYQYHLHGQVLEFVTSARYLGVDTSSVLSWNSLIDRTMYWKRESYSWIYKKKHSYQTAQGERDCLQHFSMTPTGVCLPHMGPLFQKEYTPGRKDTKKSSSLDHK